MNSATDLYQEIILSHSRHPHHFGRLENPTHQMKADNPLCGDRYEVFLQVDDDGIIRDIAFEGAGCAISKASASLMTDAAMGKSIQDFERLFTRFHDLVCGTLATPSPESMGKLAAFSGVWKFPARVKCAILCWHAVKTAIENDPMKIDVKPLTVTFETTPNPRSRKAIVDQLLREGTAATYSRSTGAFGGGPMIEHLLATDHVTDLYLRDHVMTITQDGGGSWYLLEDIITGILQAHMATHDPAYTPPEPVKAAGPNAMPIPPVKHSPALDIIREILDATITPYIASHGGAIELIEFNTETHRLTIYYDGSCGTCPSSMGATLGAVQGMLRDQYDPQLTVAVANPSPGY